MTFFNFHKMIPKINIINLRLLERCLNSAIFAIVKIARHYIIFWWKCGKSRSQIHTGLICCISIQITVLTACITLKNQLLWLQKVIFYHIFIFMHVKSIKVTSGFNLRVLKKIRQVALSYRKIKNKYLNADISTIDADPGVPGVSKDAPGSTKHAMWGLVR